MAALENPQVNAITKTKVFEGFTAENDLDIELAMEAKL
jgi:hypothetical protein